MDQSFGLEWCPPDERTERMMGYGGRPRAGHGWTGFMRGNKFISLIATCDGRWVTTGEAASWPRCSRCRKPEDQIPAESGLCVHCYYYKSPERDVNWFWAHKEDYLFPYSIGSRIAS